MAITIAEIGINHNGKTSMAYKMIDAAVFAGADIAKFQTSWNITRLSDYTFTKEEWKKVHMYCENSGIEFMSTPHEFEAIHFLDPLVSSYKIASTYLGLPNFLVEIAKKNKPIYISTGNIIKDSGMASNEEIRNALSFIPDAKITLLHCVSKYPCDNPRLERVDELKKIRRPVGISDHSLIYIYDKNYPVIEKHFKLKGIHSIDDNVSINQYQFKDMVESQK